MLSRESDLPAELSLERIGMRRSLLAQFERSRQAFDRDPAVQAHDRFRDMAFSLLTSSHVRAALDVLGHPPARP